MAWSTLADLEDMLGGRSPGKDLLCLTYYGSLTLNKFINAEVCLEHENTHYSIKYDLKEFSSTLKEINDSYLKISVLSSFKSHLLYMFKDKKASSLYKRGGRR